jgi:hypothetical protein
MAVKRKGKEWTASELRKMRTLARKGVSSRLAAVELGRTRGGVAFKAMNEGIRFHAVKQPAGVQRRPAQRRKLAQLRKARAAC